MVGSSNSNKNYISPNQKNSQYKTRSKCIVSRKSTSRFRGVLRLQNTHKWGARICFKYRTHWLGTYHLEEEAAIAYDRAAIKLQRNDSPLNFPWKIYTTQEKLFQSSYSDEEILSMIKDKTYSSNFSSFLAQQSLARKSFPGSLVNSKGMAFRLLFHKELTQTDVTHIKGFHIPKGHALQYLPLLGNSSDGGHEMGGASIDLTFYDKNHHSWSFRYSYCSSSKSFLFTRGWRHFVTMNKLNPGDNVIFYECYCVDEAGQPRKFYMLDVHRKVAENYIVDGIRGMDKDSNGVKLFGVKIG